MSGGLDFRGDAWGLCAAADFSRLYRSLLDSSPISSTWLIVGLGAQALLLAGLVGHWAATRRRRQFALPIPIIYLGLAATVVLMIYGSIRHDIVFVIGELVNMLIGFRLLEAAPYINRKGPLRDETQFPEVHPGGADRKK